MQRIEKLEKQLKNPVINEEEQGKFERKGKGKGKGKRKEKEKEKKKERRFRLLMKKKKKKWNSYPEITVDLELFVDRRFLRQLIFQLFDFPVHLFVFSFFFVILIELFDFSAEFRELFAPLLNQS